MRVCVPREPGPGEHRVALTPETVKKLRSTGFQIVLERGAGVHAGFPDDLYEDAGAELANKIARLVEERGWPTVWSGSTASTESSVWDGPRLTTCRPCNPERCSSASCSR